MSKTRRVSALAAGLGFLAAACWFVTVNFPLSAAPQMVADGPGVTVELSGNSVLHRTGVMYPEAALKAHVQGVVTFYTLYNQKPVGKHQVWVCKTLPCALRGGLDVLHHCEKRLGIHAGETTPDGKITLRTAECLASCGTAPMMQVDKEYHENLTKEAVDAILTKLSE